MKNPIGFITRKKQQDAAADAAVEVEPPQQPEQLVFKSAPDRKFPTWAHFRYATRLMEKRERILFWAALALVLVGLPVLGVRWYFSATEIGPDYGGSYTEGLVGTPQYINPLLSAYSDVDSDLSSLVYSGLFRTTDEQKLEMDLITNYVVSDDNLTYTFFLRHNVKWHDGETLDADDVLFTVAAIQDPLYRSPLQSVLKGVEAKKVDDYTVSLTLPEPFAPFLSSLTFGIMPQHLWFNVPAQNIAFTELNIKPVGTGPYKFASLTKEKTGNIKDFHVVRNDDYYGDLPYLDEITFIFYSDPMSAVEALKTKKVEGLAFYPASETAAIEKKNSSVNTYTLRIPQYTALFFNQKESDILHEDEVRYAIAYSIDRDRIIKEALYGQGEPIYAPILPGYLGYNADVRKRDFNVQAAKGTLLDAGWEWTDKAKKHNKEVLEKREAIANGEVPAEEQPQAEEAPATNENADAEEDNSLEMMPREKDGVILEFTISTVDLPEYRTTLSILQESLEEAGFKVNVDFYSPEDIQNKVIKTRSYEALLFGEIVGNDPDPYPFWHSSQQDHPGFALSIFRDTEVDDLLEEARTTDDEEERKTQYEQFQENIIDDAQAVFLYNPHYSYSIHDKIQGVNPVQYISVPSDRFARATRWYVKTKRRWK
ncbi:MAG: ABC transporter substrate-binding protein [Candidatus Kerfeldbacteria bacterium]